MWAQALIVLLGALVSSILTVGLGLFVFDRYYKSRLRDEADERIEDYTQRLRQAIGEEVDSAGEVIAQKVRTGVLDAVASIPSPEVLQETTQSVVRTGVDLVEAGLNTFLGTKPRKR